MLGELNSISTCCGGRNCVVFFGGRRRALGEVVKLECHWTWTNLVTVVRKIQRRRRWAGISGGGDGCIWAAKDLLADSVGPQTDAEHGAVEVEILDAVAGRGRSDVRRRQQRLHRLHKGGCG